MGKDWHKIDDGRLYCKSDGSRRTAVSYTHLNSELIIQELYGKLIMFNFCKTIVGGIAVKQQEYWKYEYKLNIKMAMCICREF